MVLTFLLKPLQRSVASTGVILEEDVCVAVKVCFLLHELTLADKAEY